MKRRDFLKLLGLSTGSLLLPEGVAQLIRDTCVLNNKPLIIEPPTITSVIIAMKEYDNFQFHIGDPYADPVPPSWEEWLSDQGVDFEDYEKMAEHLGCDPEDVADFDLTEPIDGCALGNWEEWGGERNDNTMGKAFNYLSNLPLCPPGSEQAGDPLGQLHFIDGAHPGSNLLYVEAPSLASIACLQHRLNELGENVRIDIRGI